MMDLYAPRSVGKAVLSALFAMISFVLVFFGFTVELYLHEFAVMMVFAVIFFGLAFFLFLMFLSREVVLRADEEGIYTMYQFYLPWKYVDKIYAKDEFFVEIKLHDNDKYLAEMDRDTYCVFFDEIEANCMHGHDMFFFYASYMGHSCEDIIKFLEEARKKYAQ